MKLEYFTAPWCQPCKTFGPRLETFATQFRFDLNKVDIQEEPEKLPPDVMGIPTVILYDGDKELSRFTGAKSTADLVKWLDSAGV